MGDTGRGVSSTARPQNGGDGGPIQHTGSLKILRHNASFKNQDQEDTPFTQISSVHTDQSTAESQALTMKRQKSGGSFMNMFGSRGTASAECSAVSRGRAELSAVSRGSAPRSTSGKDVLFQSQKSIRRMSSQDWTEITPDLSTELIRQASYSVTSSQHTL